ncbi:MAG TPA: hypothetical protein VLZ81_10410 [Blastocatellia bacterium]|nr:hypothetical protein [Blastocatellia bacterium]
MNQSHRLKLTAWFLRAFLSERDRETLVGDLIEEHNLIAKAKRERTASRWYWKQVIVSVRPLAWAWLRSGRWLKTVGAATAAYVAVALIVVLSDVAMSGLLATLGEQIYAVISLLVAFPAMMLGGFIAGSMRRSAPATLAAFSVVLGIVSLWRTGDQAPLWYQVTLILIGPVAALFGGRISARRRERAQS